MDLDGGAELAGFSSWQAGLERRLLLEAGVAPFGALGIGALATSVEASVTYASPRLEVALRAVGWTFSGWLAS